MARVMWVGRALPVRNVETIQITVDDAATTFDVDIDGVSVSVSGSGVSVNQTATDLQAALAAEGHPYFAFYSWTVATDTVTATATSSGAELVITATATGGTGTLSQSVTAAATGPHHFDNTDNWDSGSVPVSSDTLVFRDSAVPLLYALDQNALTGLSLEVWDTYTGRIGLRSDGVATVANGSSVNTAAPDPRQLALLAGFSSLDIGLQSLAAGGGNPSHLAIENNSSGASSCRIWGTAAAPAMAGRAAVYYLANHASATVRVGNITAPVAIAQLEDAETAQFSDIRFFGATGQLIVGAGCTWATMNLEGGGRHIISRAPGTATTLTVEARALARLVDGGWKVTTVNARGDIIDNHGSVAAGTSIGTLVIEAGAKVDQRGGPDRTVDTLTWKRGGELTAGPEMTYTAVTLPFTEPARVLAAAP